MAANSWRTAGERSIVPPPPQLPPLLLYGDSGLELLFGGELEFDEPPPRTVSTVSSTKLISNCSFTLTAYKIKFRINLIKMKKQKCLLK